MKKKEHTAINQPELALPDTLPDLLLAWYGENARPLPWRKDAEPYHVWLSEIMLQQTRAEVVSGYYTRFLAELPTLGALADAGEQKLLKLWESLGYYSRVRNLQKAARVILSEYGGSFPDTYASLLKLPGVGPYTAGAIASICFHEPVPAVDGNVLRVISRLMGIQEPDNADAFKRSVTEALSKIYPRTSRSGDFTQSLMELGATVCLPNGAPKCEACPVSVICKAYRENRVLPFRKTRTDRRTEERTVFVLSRGDSLALSRRENAGLLAGLWEFPNVAGPLDEPQAFALLTSWGITPVSILKSARRVHLFTHIRWNMTCYYFECSETAAHCAEAPARFTWVPRETIDRDYALPTAFRMFLE